MSQSKKTSTSTAPSPAAGEGPATEARPAIEVRKAETHNLKGIDCSIPHGKVTVVTGPSGAGKSSLAFDTIYAEGQRRFVESMSTYTRQFLQQMERPPVESLDNILPSVALEAKNSVRNARSTVGTITEVQDVLRLLLTHLGEVGCPEGHGPARRFTADEAAQLLVDGEVGERFLLLVRLPRPKKNANQVLQELIRQGFGRRLADELDDGFDEENNAQAVVRMPPSTRWPKARAELVLVLGRFRAREEARGRIAETLEQGFDMRGGQQGAEGDTAGPTAGLLEAVGEAAGEDGRRYFSRQLGCVHCGRALQAPQPALFSFNSPLGACPECQGFGRVVGIDRQRVVPNPKLTLEERPIAPWNTPAYEDLYEPLFATCKEQGIPIDVPWQELTDTQRAWVWSGTKAGKRPGRRSGNRHSGEFVNLDGFFAWLEKRTYKVHVRVLLARYRSYEPCTVCSGTRLRPAARAVTLNGRTMPELCDLSIENLRTWLQKQTWTPTQRARAGHLLEQLTERVEVLCRVGLEYLTLNRQARTLSGGETQRIHLAASLGSGLTSTLYVLDEPTIGLHPGDSHRLVSLLRELAERGNTVLVVEHDRTVIEGADYVLDLGPAAGEGGGEIVAAGSPDEIRTNPASLTGRYLHHRAPTPARKHLQRFRRERGLGSLEVDLETRPQIEIVGAQAHNLRGIDVHFPKGTLVAVTGVSGSGKSTLIENVLHGTYQRSRGVVDVEPGECKALHGLDDLADITLVDQQPIGRSTRSNPITYVGAYDEIRKLFAATADAKRGGIAAGHFSFNTDRGRCPECKGTGVTEVDMHFMAAVTVCCERCQGHRFRPEVLAVRLVGRNISEVLDLSVDAAVELFSEQKRLCRRLRLLQDVGLGYLRLGQPTSTLSGGEGQRLKLASFLDRPKKEQRRLFLFDEPTTGLHPSDIDLLYRTLRRLVQGGDTVVVVEHCSDLIVHADWIVDLGPGGGIHGGDLLYCGSLHSFVESVDSPTAVELRRFLGGLPPGSSAS